MKGFNAYEDGGFMNRIQKISKPKPQNQKISTILQTFHYSYSHNSFAKYLLFAYKSSDKLVFNAVLKHFVKHESQ